MTIVTITTQVRTECRIVYSRQAGRSPALALAHPLWVSHAALMGDSG